jgi:RNA polymerase sigma factor (sigma-70 family)
MVQDLFLSLYAENIRYNSDQQIGQYCMKRLVYRCKDYLKLKRRAVVRHHVVCDDLPSFDAFAEARLIKTNLLMKVYEEVENLSLGQRTIFKMRFQQDMTPKEISETLGITIGTVRVQLHRAAVTLKIIFGNKPWAG